MAFVMNSFSLYFLFFFSNNFFFISLTKSNESIDSPRISFFFFFENENLMKCVCFGLFTSWSAVFFGLKWAFDEFGKVQCWQFGDRFFIWITHHFEEEIQLFFQLSSWKYWTDFQKAFKLQPIFCVQILFCIILFYLLFLFFLIWFFQKGFKDLFCEHFILLEKFSQWT